MLLYLSGPMTGLPEHNYPAFTDAAAALREAGHDVLNPAETAGGVTHLERSTYLSVDVGYVQAAEGIVLLPGWTESKGAKLEVVLADSFDKPIFLYDPTAKDCLGPMVRIDEVVLCHSYMGGGTVQYMTRGAPSQHDADVEAKRAFEAEQGRERYGPGGCCA